MYFTTSKLLQRKLKKMFTKHVWYDKYDYMYDTNHKQTFLFPHLQYYTTRTCILIHQSYFPYFHSVKLWWIRMNNAFKSHTKVERTIKYIFNFIVLKFKSDIGHKNWLSDDIIIECALPTINCFICLNRVTPSFNYLLKCPHWQHRT